MSHCAPISSSALSLLLAGLALGCGDKGADDTGGADSGGADSGGTVASVGLPEGQSTWTGTGQVSGVTFLLDLTLDNDGGDLTASVTVADDPDAPVGIGSGTYTMEGTHAPESGVMALAPVAWTAEPDIAIEMVGATGSYDIDGGILSGTLRDWASGSDNSLSGGPFELTLVTGDGEPSAVGDRARALASSQTFAGTMQCTGDPRDVEGVLEHDGQGGIIGSMTVGDPGLDSPLGTFSLEGAHNPTTGGITVAPGVWEAPAPDILTFMISGTWDPASGAWTGDQLTNTAACPLGTWSTTISGG